MNDCFEKFSGFGGTGVSPVQDVKFSDSQAQLGNRKKLRKVRSGGRLARLGSFNFELYWR
jgi:hypothetical protein